jgi:hypothetical protein
MNVVEFEPARAPKKPPVKKPKKVTRSDGNKPPRSKPSRSDGPTVLRAVPVEPSDGISAAPLVEHNPMPQPALESFFSAFTDCKPPSLDAVKVEPLLPVTVAPSDGEVAVRELALTLEHLWLAACAISRLAWRMGRGAFR